MRRYWFGITALIALVPLIAGCQRVAFVNLRNETSQTLVITEQAHGEIMGEVPPHSERQLKRAILIQGTQPVSLRIASSNDRLVVSLQLPMAVARRSARSNTPVAITCREDTSSCFFAN